MCRILLRQLRFLQPASLGARRSETGSVAPCGFSVRLRSFSLQAAMAIFHLQNSGEMKTLFWEQRISHFQIETAITPLSRQFQFSFLLSVHTGHGTVSVGRFS